MQALREGLLRRPVVPRAPACLSQLLSAGQGVQERTSEQSSVAQPSTMTGPWIGKIWFFLIIVMFLARERHVVLLVLHHALRIGEEDL